MHISDECTNDFFTTTSPRHRTNQPRTCRHCHAAQCPLSHGVLKAWELKMLVAKCSQTAVAACKKNNNDHFKTASSCPAFYLELGRPARALGAIY